MSKILESLLLQKKKSKEIKKKKKLFTYFSKYYSTWFEFGCVIEALDTI